MNPDRGDGPAIWAAALVLSMGLFGLGACGGGGEKPPTFTPVSATKDGDLYTLQLGDLKMVVDGARGAVITELSLDGKNALLTRDENSPYGSIFWPSPQSSWCAAGGACWPRPAGIDSQVYTGTIDDPNRITLSSGTAPFLGGQITASKQLTPVPESGAVDITYTLTNLSTDASVSLAPWLVSRVATGGLTFFAQGSVPVTYAADNDPTFTVTDATGNSWYDFAPVTHNSKAFADAGGWLAHATPSGLLYMVSYPDIQPAEAAPGEAEVEVFANRDYVEIENQGTLAPLAPGEALTWTVRWKLRRVPANAKLDAGDPTLTAFAAKTLAE